MKASEPGSTCTLGMSQGHGAPAILGASLPALRQGIAFYLSASVVGHATLTMGPQVIMAHNGCLYLALVPPPLFRPHVAVATGCRSAQLFPCDLVFKIFGANLVQRPLASWPELSRLWLSLHWTSNGRITMSVSMDHIGSWSEVLPDTLPQYHQRVLLPETCAHSHQTNKRRFTRDVVFKFSAKLAQL